MFKIPFLRSLSAWSCIFLLTFSPAVRAESDTIPSKEDLFAELDLLTAEDSELDASAASDGTSKKKEGFPGILQDLGKNAEFKAIGRAITYFRKAPPREQLDNHYFHADGRLEFKSNVVRDSHLFGFSGWTEFGSQRDTYSQSRYYLGLKDTHSHIERKRRIFELNEIYFTESFDNFDVTVGRKEFPMGLAPLFSPADRITTSDLNDPLDPKRFGMWQAVIDYFVGATTFTAAIFPFWVQGKRPSPDSRWSTSSGAQNVVPPPIFVPGPFGPIPVDFQFFNQGVDPGAQIGEDLPRDEDRIGLLGRVKTTVKGWDLFAAAFHGMAAYPVLRKGNVDRQEAENVREHITATTLSTGFSTTWKKLEFHGEGLIQISDQDKDDDYFTHVTGITYTEDELVTKIGLEKVELIVDYAGEVILDNQDRDRYEDSSADLRRGQRDFIMRGVAKVNEHLRFESALNINLDEDGQVIIVGGDYEIKDGLWLKVRSEFFNGPDDSYYGRWARNKRLITSIEYSF